MNKVILSTVSSFILLTFNSCADKIVPFNTETKNTVFEVKTSKDFDSVWDNLIDLFAQKGFSIKTIDRSSGLIISGPALLPTTLEKKGGVFEDSTAFVVVSRTYNVGRDKAVPIVGFKTGKSSPNDVFGEWNVRIKKLSDGGTSINVNLVNIEYEERVDNRFIGKRQLHSSNYYSTKVFENIIANMIK